MPRINQLPAASSVAQTDVLAIDTTDKAYKVPRSVLAPAPYIATIPTGQWSGSGSDRYITVTASNVTADAMLYPFYDNASAALLNGPVWVIPAAGSFTIHTSAIPSGTVTISVLLAGIVGEAQYQVLADVYSKSQVDTIVSQSTADAVAQTNALILNDTTWTGLLAKLRAGLNNQHGRAIALFVCYNTTATSILTGGRVTSYMKGYVTLSGANTNLYDFFGGALSNGDMYAWRVTASDSEPTISNFRRFVDYEQSTAITSGESSIDAPSGVTLHHPYLKKSGRICLFKVNVTIGSSLAGTNAVILTLPAGFRPSEQFDFFATATYGGTKSTYTFAIKTNGEVVTATGSNTFSGAILVDVSFVI